jgi:hypothetical protein
MNNGEEPIAPRIEGQSPSSIPTRGYTNFNELSADRKASQKNPSMKEAYLKKLALTDDKVLSLYS